MQLMHHSEFDIFKMECRMVADKFNQPVTIPLPSAFGWSNVGCIGNFLTDQQAWPIVWHHTNRHWCSWDTTPVGMAYS